MMITLQNKIIYMPNIPPYSRSETIDDYAGQCRPVQWKDDSLVTGDGARISLAVGEIPKDEDTSKVENGGEDVVVLYFQGNASSLPPRLPYLSRVLRMADGDGMLSIANGLKKNITIVAVSYRGYWTSTGSPSQKGIEQDADAALSWVLERYFSRDSPRRRKLMIWGQSIGAGVATNLTANYLHDPHAFRAQSQPAPQDESVVLSGLILETPFTNMRDLLVAFYPQKWHPYRYLSPFVRSHWDSLQSTQRIAEAPADHKRPRIFMLEAGADEVVPAGNAEQLERHCRELGLDVERRVIRNALHSGVLAKRDGQVLVAQFLRDESGKIAVS
ncbi:alpha/beta hydrolase [Aspergillus chevalieri]|uniref:Alpha/beta superfamily hydrolase n=1 Tax=Aspergillus chevalieri TaxID=182096 RepID=A0A7R7VGH4_ASPCH|nr:uncharacterized protein ACHE_11653S [Aspergillus chevalieri]BCR84251.1 hypothetical protein ACHE_11653S [Aspergillus chevalieri]